MSNTTKLYAATQARIKDMGKQVMQIMTLQCQSLYTTGMTESAFIETVYGDIAASNRTIEGVNFFKQVYAHLAANRTFSEVEEMETGDVTLALYQEAISLSSTRTTTNNLDVIVISADNNTVGCIPWWVWVILALLALIMKKDSHQEE